MEHMNTLCEQDADLRYVETGGEYSTHSDFRAEGRFSHCAGSLLLQVRHCNQLSLSRSLVDAKFEMPFIPQFVPVIRGSKHEYYES
jgi:hypothetical protein